MRNLILALSISLISGCVSLYEPVPQDYNGEVAQVSDSYSNMGDSSAHYFFVHQIDGKAIPQSWNQTREVNRGLGTSFTPSMVTRKVFPQKQRLLLIGVVFYPTNEQGLFSDDMQVSKEVIFTPKAGETYKVNGTLNKAGSKVWLEDSAGKIVESEGGS